MRAVVETAVRRPVTVIMTAIAVMAFGFVGYSRLTYELFPDITYPSLTVQTDFPDTAPQDVENLVTRLVEEAVGVLRGLQTIHSVSRSGTSEVTLEFEWGSNMDLLSMEVREKLDRIVLPEEAEDPIVLRFDPSLDPIVRVALHTAGERAGGPGGGGGDGSEADLTRMRYFAEKKIKLDLETIKGVASAQVRGGFEEEVQIEIDQERLAALGVPLERVRQVVGVSNVNRPGGALRGSESEYLIRTVNEYDDVEEIGDLIIWRGADGGDIHLRDVARVYMGTKEREEITRVGGEESVELSIYKEGDANTVSAAAEIRARLAEWKRKLPPGYDLTILFDQSEFIRQAVDEVRDAALIGGLLAVLVLLAFLRDLRSTLIIATSIPISVIATFVFMYRLDISLNIMSLGGLTLGVGMLVDSSIVVLESVFRRRQRGEGVVTAAVEGTAEVGPAVVASTLTTVAVFLPIVFVEGIAGQLFKDQALTVTISLLASLVVAVTVIPMLCVLGRRDRAAAGTSGAAAPRGLHGVEMTLGVVSRLYDGLLRASLRARWVTLAVAFGLFGAAIWSLRLIDTELVPTLTEGEFFFEVNMPEGTSLHATDRIVTAMESAAREIDTIGFTYSTIGSRLVAGGITMNTMGENLAQLNVVMREGAGDEAEERAIESLRERFEGIPDLEIKFGRPSYFSLKTPIEVIVFGENLDDLRRYSLELAARLERVPGLVDVRSSLEAGNPEIQVTFDRDALAARSLSLATLSDTLRDRVLGAVPTRFKEEDREIDIRIRNAERFRGKVADVANLVLPGPGGAPIRLLSVADVRIGRGPAEIHRLQQQRAAVISANLAGRGLGGAIEDVRRTIASAPPGPGMSVELGGQNREMEVSFASLQFAIALAIFLVYLVMASTFESFIHPFVVLFTIPLSLVGVVAGLLATGTTVTVIVLIGCIMLVGIVVNNAIVLIDAINRFRARGAGKLEAVRRAGHVRLRPILMTTLTTILGLLPMAIGWGEGSELRAPLAITVASGLLLSTLLTLVVIPALYLVVPSRVDAAVVLEDPRAGSGGDA